MKELRQMGYSIGLDERTAGPINAIYFDWEHGTFWVGQVITERIMGLDGNGNCISVMTKLFIRILTDEHFYKINVYNIAPLYQTDFRNLDIRVVIYPTKKFDARYKF